MAYRVDVTAPAEADIFATVSFIARYSLPAADRWLTGISRSIRSLSVMPARCATAPESREFEIEIRHLMYGTGRNIYRILFRIVDAELVQVIAVRHGARDVMRP